MKFEGAQVGVSWSTVKLEYNTSLDIIKTALFQLVTSIKVEGTSHGPFQRQCFQGYFDSAMDIFSTSKKDQTFLAWKGIYYAIWCMPLILSSYIC